MRSMLLLQFLLEVSDKCTSFKLGLEERKYIYFLNPVKSFCMLLVPKKKIYPARNCFLLFCWYDFFKESHQTIRDECCFNLVGCEICGIASTSKWRSVDHILNINMSGRRSEDCFPISTPVLRVSAPPHFSNCLFHLQRFPPAAISLDFNSLCGCGWLTALGKPCKSCLQPTLTNWKSLGAETKGRNGVTQPGCFFFLFYKKHFSPTLGGWQWR